MRATGRTRPLKFKIPADRLLRRQVFTRDNFTCQGCGWRPPGEKIPADYDGRYGIGIMSGRSLSFQQLEVDHIVPRLRGGANSIENLQTLCSTCNRSKGAR